MVLLFDNMSVWSWVKVWHLKIPCRHNLLFIYLSTYFIYQLFWTQACPEGMCTNGTQVPCQVPSLPNPTTHKGWPHHQVYDPYSFQIVMWVLLSPTRKNQWKCCEKSNHLQRQHFLLSYLKTECWSSQGLNPWPPAQQTGALPTELTRWL